MRKAIHSLLIAVGVLVGTVALAIGATMTSAVSMAARAFIVPGTGTPDANVVGGYMEQALNRYIAPFNPSCTAENDCTLEGINYPASFWPLSFFSGWCVPGRCEKWDVSVDEGQANLHAALEPYLGTDEEVVIFGYSQGSAVTSDEMRFLGENYAPDQFDNFRVVNIGSIDNRVGGAWTVLGFLDYIPILDITTNLFNPIATGMPMTTINFQYDPVGDLPLYFNLLAVVNALVAMETVHGFYLEPNEDDPTASLPYGYTDETLAEQLNCAATNNCKKDEFGNLYVTIPARGLPLTNAVRSAVDGIGLGWLVNPFIDLVEPMMKVIIDTAYDPEANPGDVRYLSLLPFNPKTNLLKFGNDLFRAGVEGVEAFVEAIFNPSAVTIAPHSPQSTVAAPEAQGALAPVDDTTSGTGDEGSNSESGPVSEPAESDQPAEISVESAVTEETVGDDEATEEAVGDAEPAEEAVEAAEPAEEAIEDSEAVDEDAIEIDPTEAEEEAAEEDASGVEANESDATEGEADTDSTSDEADSDGADSDGADSDSAGAAEQAA
ncbi:MAG: PE-PPE domain-containing protein [Mycobacterium sp.]